MDCLFCKIAAGEIPSNKVYEDDYILAFHDVSPQAPVHILIIPKVHTPSAQTVTPADAQTIAHLFKTLPEITATLDLKEGYRVVTNIGVHGGQSVDHLHFHLLGGRQLVWPPG